MKKIFFLIFILISTVSVAQTFEIRTHYSSGNSITVDMRCTSEPHPTTSNYILDIVFGIKWLNSYNVNLGDASGDYHIGKSDIEKVNGSYEFQAFDIETTYSFPEDWDLNVWKTIATIPIENGSGSGTFEICEVGFDETTDLNINIDGTDYTPTINGSATGVPLFINLEKFSTRKYNSTSSYLFWTSENEVDFDRFEIQRSIDGRNWVYAGTVKSYSLFRSSDYSFIDRDVYDGVGDQTFYYRLKLIDIDGGYRFSKIRDVTFESKDAVVDLEIYPNPSSEKVFFTLSGIDSDSDVNIDIFDINGKIAYKKNMENLSKSNLLLDNTITRLQSGMYNVIISDKKGHRVYKKLILAR